MSSPGESATQMSLTHRVRELEMMVQVSRTLTSMLDLERLLQLIIQMATELVGCQGASIILEDRQSGELIFREASGPKSAKLSGVRVPVEGSIAGTVFKSQQPLIIQDTDDGSAPRHYDQVDRDIEFETQSILAVPMLFKEQAIGVLEAVNKRNREQFNRHDVQVLSTLAAQAAVAIENARLVKELQEANDRLAELDRLKSDFIAIASHELRTPLGLILGYASFLRDQAEGKTSEQLSVVLDAATQLKSLIEDMVNLTHLEAGSAELDLQDVVLQDVIKDSIAAQHQFATTKSLAISHSLPHTPIRVKIDSEKIAIVLNNLLNNAIKFTAKGGRIRVAVRPLTGIVSVSVADTGIGIPQEELERIFDRFYQVESHLTRHTGGMGLGLSIAKGMVELHGGRIWAESVENRGSRCTFTLPVQWEEATGERI
jgi:signal transduction histidine kinase